MPDPFMGQFWTVIALFLAFVLGVGGTIYYIVKWIKGRK